MHYNYYSDENITTLAANEIFVFGSNLAGRHGKGAAKVAKDNFGAEYGIGCGFTGNTYALPTKDIILKTLSLEEIKEYIRLFQIHASAYPNTSFIVTKIGCGLAGYKDHEIAPLFKGSPSNCKFHLDWKEYLE